MHNLGTKMFAVEDQKYVSVKCSRKKMTSNSTVQSLGLIDFKLHASYQVAAIALQCANFMSKILRLNALGAQ